MKRTLALLLLAAPALAAAPDGVIEWEGISHIPTMDRRPLCPIDGQSFQVRFQALKDDLTSATVHGSTGSPFTVPTSPTETRGPYDVWTAQIPATVSTSENYYLELSDGSATGYLSVSGHTAALPQDGGFVLNFTTLSHAPLGATLVPGNGAVFNVWAPTRSSAYVRGAFNGWGLGSPMTKVGERFIRHVTNAQSRQEYKFFFNPGGVWNTDARARALNAGNQLNAFVENPFAYTWAVADFEAPPLDAMVIYQLHVGTFSGRNDPLGSPPHPGGYLDVAARAAHLADLGVNAVQLNPVTEFPGDLSAGYNPMTQWSPEWKYGDPDELKAMVDALHQNGIAVLLDIVWNHFTVNDNFMWYYDGSQTYFDDPHVDTPWGAQADFDEPEVRDYFAESARLWLEEYRMDGFRADATAFMDLPPHNVSGYALMQRLNDEVDNRSADKVVIAEELPNDLSITTPTSLGGAGFDSQYHDAFTDGLREEILDAYAGNGPSMSRVRSFILGTPPYLSGSRAFNYLELHDEVWPSNGGQRLVKNVDPTFPHDDDFAKGYAKLGQALVLFSPGVPAMHQGSEWLEDTGFGSDAANRIDWSKKTTYAPIFAFMKDAIALRKANPAIHADASVDVYHVNESGDVVGFARNEGDSTVVVIANFSNANYPAYRIGLPEPGNWSEALNSQAASYDGNDRTNPGPLSAEPIARDGQAQSFVIQIPRMSVLVFRAVSQSVSAADPELALRPMRVEPNPVRDSATIAFRIEQPGQVTLSLHDLRGRLVRRLLDGHVDAGDRAIRWDGRGEAGGALPSGVYFLRLDQSGRRSSAKLILAGS